MDDRSVDALFDDAYQAGELLGIHLATLPYIQALDHEQTVLVGVTEGGLPLAYMVSAALPLRIEPAPVASIHAPFQRDIRVGMLVDDGTLYLEQQLGVEHGASGTTLDHLADRAEAGLVELMRDIGDRPGADVAGCDVILVDDIIGTGMTAVACADWLRRWGARSVHMAAAAATPSGLDRAREVADTVEVLAMLEADRGPGEVFARVVAPGMRQVTQLARAISHSSVDQDAHTR